MNDTSVVQPARTWTSVGADFNSTTEQRAALSAVIDQFRWLPLPIRDAPFLQAYAIKATIADLKIPNVRRVAYNGVVGTYGFYGIEGRYQQGTARIFMIDRGPDLVIVASELWEGCEPE